MAHLVETLRYKPEHRRFDSWRCHNPSSRDMDLGSTHPLKETSTRSIYWMVNAAGARGWQPIFSQSVSLKLLEPAGLLTGLHRNCRAVTFLQTIKTLNYATAQHLNHEFSIFCTMTHILLISHWAKISSDANASNSELGFNLPALSHTTRRGSYHQVLHFVCQNTWQPTVYNWLVIISYTLKNWTFNTLTPELNPSVQRCLTRFFTGDFASW
jgi:hypothetical protein